MAMLQWMLRAVALLGLLLCGHGTLPPQLGRYTVVTCNGTASDLQASHGASLPLSAGAVR
jgi:hypothetical protein